MEKTLSQPEAIILSTDSYTNVPELIKRRAYELFQQRGQQHGRDVEDWLQAESEITTSKATKAAA